MGSAQVPRSVLDLVEKFDTQGDLYHGPAYNETQCRIDFEEEIRIVEEASG